MSYPAADTLPLVGALADGESFLTSKGGDWAIFVTGGRSVEGEDMVFGRFARGDAGNEAVDDLSLRLMPETIRA